MSNQTLILITLAAVAMTSGCASTQADKLAVCDGKHRRPANPYGSVLPTAALPAPDPAPSKAAPQGPTDVPLQPPAVKRSEPPGRLSQVDSKSLAPCGRAA